MTLRFYDDDGDDDDGEGHDDGNDGDDDILRQPLRYDRSLLPSLTFLQISRYKSAQKWWNMK